MDPRLRTLLPTPADPPRRFRSGQEPHLPHLPKVSPEQLIAASALTALDGFNPWVPTAEPKPNCKHCHGTGQRARKRPCHCIRRSRQHDTRRIVREQAVLQAAEKALFGEPDPDLDVPPEAAISA